jgi:hypothetical protein
MKDAEDEAFDDLAKKQGMWGGGFQAKRQMAADKMQEPVAWMVYTQDGQSVYVTDNPTDIQKGQRALPLYTTPPKREWVGLTDEEAYDLLGVNYNIFAIRAIEKALQEKNT